MTTGFCGRYAHVQRFRDSRSVSRLAGVGQLVLVDDLDRARGPREHVHDEIGGSTTSASHAYSTADPSRLGLALRDRGSR